MSAVGSKPIQSRAGGVEARACPHQRDDQNVGNWSLKFEYLFPILPLVVLLLTLAFRGSRPPGRTSRMISCVSA